MACSAADYGVANFLGNYDAVVSLLTHLSLVERIKCGRVCKAFYEGMHAPALWTEMDLSKDGLQEVVTEEVLTELLTTYPLASSASLLLNGCTNLTDVGLSRAFQLADVSNVVSELSLANVSSVKFSTMEQVLSCEKLTSLDLRGCTSLTGGDYQVAALQVARRKESERNRREGKKVPLKEFARRRAAEYKLRVSARAADGGGGGGGGGGGIKLDSAPTLKDLKVFRVGYYSEAMLADQDTILSLVMMAQTDSIASLLSQVPDGLQIFEANGFLGMDERHVVSLATRCSSLTRVALPYTQSISSVSLQRLAASCSGLTHLNLRACPLVDDVGLKALCTLPGMQFLNISCCNRVTDAGFADFVNASAGLVDVDVCYCEGLSRASFELAIAKLPLLVNVGWSGFPDLTDKDILLAVEKLPTLKKLAIGGCINLTSVALSAIGGGLTQLEGLMLHKLVLEQEQLLATVVALKEVLQGLDLTDCTFTPPPPPPHAAAHGINPVDSVWAKVLACNPRLRRGYWEEDRPI